MIARHCHQESDKGEGVEVIKYEACEDPVHGPGHYTEKRLHLYRFIENNFFEFLKLQFLGRTKCTI